VIKLWIASNNAVDIIGSLKDVLLGTAWQFDEKLS